MLDAKKIAGYDKSMVDPIQLAYYGHSDFYNYGYWTLETKTQREACENLVDKLLDFIPEKTGTILDVACGMGATTRHLLKYYAPENVTGINLSEAQLDRARKNAPGATFLYMDAVKLDFPDESIDNIISVEAVFHFNTREKFYREALRVLKPGGHVVTTDIQGPRWVWKSNYFRDANELKAQLAKLGFQDVQVINTTDESWKGFCRNLKRWPGQERKAGRLDMKSYLRAKALAIVYPWFLGLGTKSYYVTSVQKP